VYFDPAHLRCQRSEFDAMSVQNARDMEKGLKKMHERIDKHMCAEAGLLRVMWEKTAEVFGSMYAEFEALAAQCFESSLAPTCAELRAMASAISKQAAAPRSAGPGNAMSSANVARDAAYAATAESRT
jgi:hypothetical protein